METWKPEWYRLFNSTDISVFGSFEWVCWQLERCESGFVLLLHEGGHLHAALPLRESYLKNKLTKRFKTLEHLCFDHTDFHEFLIEPCIDLSTVATLLIRYIHQHFRRSCLKVDFPPPNSLTLKLLKLMSHSYDIANADAHYMVQHNCGTNRLDKNLRKDIQRREKKLTQQGTVVFTLQERLSSGVLGEVLELHRLHHGDSSFNSKEMRSEVMDVLTKLSERVICSTLKVNDILVACAISFKQGEQLHYFAPACRGEFRSCGVGLILINKIINGLFSINAKGLCFLRGEEPYKVRMASSAIRVAPFIAIPRVLFSAEKIFIFALFARNNRASQVKRLNLSRHLTKDLRGGKAIVLANGLNGLGVIRSLAIAGIEVIAICPSHKDLTALSRLPRETHIISENDNWESAILEVVNDVAKSCTFPIAMFTCSDKSANFVEKNYEYFPSNVRCIYPTGNLTQVLNDKQRELSLMHDAAVPLPNSVWQINGERPFDSLSIPLIIKPKDYSGYRILKAKNVIIEHTDELDSFYDQYSDNLNSFVAQEMVEGKDENLWVCNATFDKHSTMVTAFTFKRLGTSPSHYGVTTSAISENNSEIKELVKKLGEKIRYQGPGMWEFKYCSTRREYLYIETNPRLGMCNWFDTQCNVNNVLATYHLATDKKVNPLMWQQSEGVFYMNSLGDFIARVENKESPLSILHRMIWVLNGPCVWSTWCRKDPMPTFISSLIQLKNLGKRLVRKVNFLRRG